MDDREGIYLISGNEVPHELLVAKSRPKPLPLNFGHKKFGGLWLGHWLSIVDIV
jgi:hypothetical protein